MTDFLYNIICIMAQDEMNLPEGLQDLLVDSDGDFTYDKTRPGEEFDDFVDEASEIEVIGNSLIFSIETPDDSNHIWLRNLSSIYPNLMIECEYHCLSDEEFGRLVWLKGEIVYSSQRGSFSRERFSYFGGDPEECEDWSYTEFEDDGNKRAVDEIQKSIESKNWIALMDALLTARHQLEYFVNPNLSEDKLRVAIVANEAALLLLSLVLKDPKVDSEAIAGIIGCKSESLDEALEEECEPEEPATRDELLELLKTIAVESARLLSLSTLHSTKREIIRLK